MDVTAWKISYEYTTINDMDVFNDLCNSSSRCLEKYTWYSNIRCNLFMSKWHKLCICENAHTYLGIKTKIKFLLHYPVQLLKGNTVYHQYEMPCRLRTMKILIFHITSIYIFLRGEIISFFYTPKTKTLPRLVWS